MGISSLGAGSSILTQDVIDQLKAADEAKFVAPVDARIEEQEDKEAALSVVDALMDNVYESLKSLTEYGVFESRVTTVSNETAVEVTAAESSDIQAFTLEVGTLATSQIEQSGTFTSKTSKIADGVGTMTLAVGAETFDIEYDANTTIDDLKELINKDAGDSVTASIIQISTGDFRLMLSADNTGTGQAISITDDASANLKDDNALTSLTNVQTAVNASFKFNGLDIERTSNTVDDLLSGVTITLKDTTTSKVNVSVEQDRENIESKITNFIDKYNSAMYQLNEDTKSSEEVSERGVFSSDSTIKSMKSSLINILSTIGEGQGKIQDYGIEVDEDGRLSLDASALNEKLDEDPASTQAFFVGGTFTKENGSTVELTGAFEEMEEEVAKYSKYNAVLDIFKTSISDRMESLNEQREKAVARLESSYATMAKRFAAYDAMISKFNSASSMFTQMINAEIAAKS